MSTERCPHCGADIRAGAKSCPHCGSSDADGWRDEWHDDGGGDDDDFDYESFVEDEFSDRVTNTSTPVVWRFVAVVLLLSFLLGSLFLF